MEGLPEWLDLARIAGIGVLVLVVVQYIKTYIPDKWIKLVAVIIGVLLSFAAVYYMGSKGPIVWNIGFVIRVILDGVLSAMLGDTAYQFLSKKGGGSGILPSK